MSSLFGFGGAVVGVTTLAESVSLAGMSVPDARTRRKISLRPARVLSVSYAVASSASAHLLTGSQTRHKDIPQDSPFEHPLRPCTLCSKGVPALLRCRCLLGGHESPRFGCTRHVGPGGLNLGVLERSPDRSRSLPSLFVVSSQNSAVDRARRILALALYTASSVVYCPLSTALTSVCSPCGPVNGKNSPPS